MENEESDLFKVINQGFSADKQAQFIELIRKRQAESITQEELDELIRLTNEAESRNVRRLEALIKLAQLRAVSMPELMDSLGIKPPPVM